MKVLYIDDEADTEKMASKFEIIKENGIDVIPLTRVEEVLPTLKRIHKEIGLIVLDIIMPPEDIYTLEETDGGTTTGLRLLSDIRKEYTDIPIIIVSVKRLNHVDEIRSKYNVSEYLEKPVPAFDVAKSIKRYMK